jgi:hypothetical protein
MKDTVTDYSPDILHRVAKPLARVIQPREPLQVTLEARQWEAVMTVLAEASYRIAAPLIEAIRGQCMTAGADTTVCGRSDA